MDQAARLKVLVPPCADLPPALTKLLGGKANAASIVWYAAADRRTSRNSRKAVVALMTHTSLCLVDDNGMVRRMVSIPEIESPVTQGRQSPHHPVENVLLTIAGEADLLIYFVASSGGEGTSEARKLAATINQGPESTPAMFVQRLKTLRDAFVPDSPLLCVDAEPARTKGRAKLKAPAGAPASPKDKMSQLENSVRHRNSVFTPLQLPDDDAVAGTSTATADRGFDRDSPMASSVNTTAMMAATVTATAEEDDDLDASVRSNIAEAIAQLKKDNRQLRDHLKAIEGDRRKSNDELRQLRDERTQLLEAQAQQTGGARTSADDVSQLVRQLLALQKQLLEERHQRQQLIDIAISATEAKYDRILVRQQDELTAAHERVAELEALFESMQVSVKAVSAAPPVAASSATQHWRQRQAHAARAPNAPAASLLTSSLDRGTLRYSLMLDA
jgi:hypothetical protein